MRGCEFDKRVRECNVLAVRDRLCCLRSGRRQDRRKRERAGERVCGHTCVSMIRHRIILTDRIWMIKKCGGKPFNISTINPNKWVNLIDMIRAC